MEKEVEAGDETTSDEIELVEVQELKSVPASREVFFRSGMAFSDQMWAALLHNGQKGTQNTLPGTLFTIYQFCIDYFNVSRFEQDRGYNQWSDDLIILCRYNVRMIFIHQYNPICMNIYLPRMKRRERVFLDIFVDLFLVKENPEATCDSKNIGRRHWIKKI